MSKGQLLGDRFELEVLIGQGTFGEVYRGRDRQAGSAVAIKMLKTDLVRDDPQLVERFRREGEVLRRLNHPNIVKVFDAFSEDDRHYIVMEYVGAGSLTRLLRQQPQLAVEHTLEIALDLSDALVRTHRLQIIHRDIKPANVLLASDGTPRLTDFGVAHIGDLFALTQAGRGPGTIVYMSPEACRGEEVDARTDIWAFGVMLYEMLAGRRPFEGFDAILNHPMPDLSRFRDDLPPALIHLIGRTLEKDRQKRINSVRRISAEIEAIIQQVRGPSGRALPSDDRPQSIAIGEALPEVPSPSTMPDRGSAPPKSTLLLTPTFAYAASTRADVPGGANASDSNGESGITTMSQALNFDLILDSTAAGYRVQVKSPRGIGELSPRPVVLPFDLDALPQTRSDIAHWVERARNPHLGPRGHHAQARAFGTALFKSIFIDEVLASFRASRAALQEGEYLRLRLNLPDSLVTLPWELLYDEHDGEFLVLTENLSLVRYPQIPRPIKPLQVEGPLQVVVVLACPVGDERYQEIDLDAERRRIEATFKDAHASGRVDLDIIHGPRTLKQLRTRLRRPIHVLHILCHGDMDRDAGEGVLIFEDADRATEQVSADLLRMHFLEQRQQLRLVLLNACQGALPASEDVFSGVGATLVRAGVPSVIAMQFDISEDAAAELTEVFYYELMLGMPVDYGLTRARRSLASRFRSGLDWAIPVLFLRADDGLLFTGFANTLTHIRPEPPATRPESSHVRPKLTQAALEVLWQRAQIAYFTNNWIEAEKLLAQIAEVRPNYRDVQSRLDKVRRQLYLEAFYRDICALRDADELEAVIGALEELNRQHPDYPDPGDIRGWVAAQQQREQLYEKAFFAHDRSDWATAITTLEEFLAKFPNDPGVQALLNHARNEQEQQRSREEVAEQRRRQAAERLYREQLGLDLIQRGAYVEALDRLEQRVQEAPGDSDIKQVLARLMAERQIPLSQRLRAAQLTVQVGDPRPGVCDLPPAMIPLTGGRFTMGSTRDEVLRAGVAHEREQRGEPDSQGDPRTWSEDEINDQPTIVPDFEIASYPVTNAQYELFVRDNGYDPRKPWWKKAGRIWLEAEEVHEPELWRDRRFGRAQANYPVVGVSWYEAHAFCEWLRDHRTYNPHGHHYRLPTEAEWEYAARGNERRLYPWGTQRPNGDLANFNSAHSGPTPVGCFLLGETPTRIFDLAGNVWEWTSSIYRPYPFDPHDTDPFLASVDIARVSFTVRGGCWRSKPTLLRASHRYYYRPENSHNYLGFRLVYTRT